MSRFYPWRGVYGVRAIRYLPDQSNQAEVCRQTGGQPAGSVNQLIGLNTRPHRVFARPGDYIVWTDDGFEVMPASEFEDHYAVRKDRADEGR